VIDKIEFLAENTMVGLSYFEFEKPSEEFWLFGESLNFYVEKDVIVLSL
jgi:hypothetical protein